MHPDDWSAELQPGVTNTEKYLGRLCRRSFLSLWSYSNLYRDQGKQGNGHGKEICDLLVVFGNELIVFSDKRSEWDSKVETDLAWCRWYKRVVEESVGELRGAERWLRTHPDRVFLDRACTQKFPLALPSGDQLSVHLVGVANGAADACRQHFGERRGSLIVAPSQPPPRFDRTRPGSVSPFFLGDPDPHHTFVHIIDEAALDIVLRELDTIRDFLDYLRAKKDLIRSGKLLLAAGEEEILAYYLRKRYLGPTKAFSGLTGYDTFTLDVGHWDGVLEHPQYQAKKDADQVSYLWDSLIENTAGHLRAGTLALGDNASTERALRELASCTRFERRILSEALLDVRTRGQGRNTYSPFVRTILPTGWSTEAAAVVMVAMSRGGAESDESYRERRYAFLKCYADIVGVENPSVNRVLAIATEPAQSVVVSHDILVLDNTQWTPEEIAEVKKLKSDLGLYDRERLPSHRYRSKEYPIPNRVEPVKVGPNQKCPCGSGKKFKRCCAP